MNDKLPQDSFGLILFNMFAEINKGQAAYFQIEKIERERSERQKAIQQVKS